MAKSQKKKVGIIGVGFVGGALADYFKTRPVELFLYDKYKKIGSPEQVSRAEIIFVATPTPFLPSGGFDLSLVEDAIQNIAGNKTVVIKSSVVPGSTEKLQKKFPRHKILFSPEFLREVSAFEDMIHPDRQLMGYTASSRSIAAAALKLLPRAPYEKIMPAGEAEMVKYMANAFLALKVVFGNEFCGLCEKLGIDYDEVRRAVVKDPRIGDSHFDVAHGGYRGYGGSCFPKDVNAIIQLAAERKAPLPLLEGMRKINRRLLKSSGLNEIYFLKNKHKKVGS